jgi:hypothetical protein
LFGNPEKWRKRESLEELLREKNIKAAGLFF